MIARQLESVIRKKMADDKAIVLLGPRQVGKTTLVRELLRKKREEAIYWNGDEADIREFLKNPTSTAIRAALGNKRLLVIDEAQRIQNIGLVIKLIVDEIKPVKVIATGSSAFELANKINEPLTGRKWEYTLYPISFAEMVNHTTLLEEKRMLEHRLIYGYYPEIVNHPGKEKERLSQLANSYLYKDILTWERIQKPDKLERLVQALAFQVGNLVSYHELGQITGLDNETVEHYIQLLEKAFIVFRLGPLSRNLRNELKKARKIYFYDNGLRNAVIKQFNPIGLREDKGALWENFLISERMKWLGYQCIYANTFFWRNHAQQEIDYIEERDGEMMAYEFKWSTAKSKIKFPKAFTEAYHPVSLKVITPENYTDWLLPLNVE